MIRVAVGAGTIDANVFNFKTEIAKREKFYLEALRLNCCDFDTARSYYSGYAERTLGSAIKLSGTTRSKFEVETKVGGITNHAPLPFNHLLVNSRVIQKYQIVSKRVVDGFDSWVKPSKIPRLLTDSLRRLNLDYVDTYYLHSHGQLKVYELYVEVLQKLQGLGMAKSIGVSIDHKTDLSITWCDKIQIPLALVDEFPNFQGRIVVNQVFSGNNGSLKDILEKIKRDQRITKVVLGTKKFDRIAKFQKELNNQEKYNGG